MNEVVHIVGSNELIEEFNLVEFRLLYEGKLLPSGNQNKRGKEKHKIRRVFHPQLRRLWHVNPNLRQLAASQPAGTIDELMIKLNRPIPPGPTEEERVELGWKSFGDNWNRLGYNFVPLVTEKMVLRCSLDILLLRPGDQKHIYRMGDIDGQLKTLFDALRMPDQEGEIGKDNGPNDDEHPFFCLLQDDRLITEVRVVTDELLLLPNHKEVKANDAFVIIDVKLNHKDARTFDNIFG
ncbi:MAG: hypothetical protein ABSA46_08520 [Thermodesulfovibrionales bacterium]|jgi:hypothetical protein